MGKLLLLAEKSKLMDISIVYGKETIHFNLFEELKIYEGKVNLEAEQQPKIFGFLGILHKKLTRLRDDAKIEMERSLNAAFVRAKRKLNENTQRPNSDDFADARAATDIGYIEASKKYHELKEKAGIIESCLNSFEQRGFLIQTISANLRKTN